MNLKVVMSPVIYYFSSFLYIKDITLLSSEDSKMHICLFTDITVHKNIIMIIRYIMTLHQNQSADTYFHYAANCLETVLLQQLLLKHPCRVSPPTPWVWYLTNHLVPTISNTVTAFLSLPNFVFFFYENYMKS